MAGVLLGGGWAVYLWRMRARDRATPRTGAGEGAGHRLRRLDRGLMRRARRVDSPALDRALVAHHDGGQLLAAVARDRRPARRWRADPRGRAAAGRGLLALVIAGIATNGPAKLLTRRRRPC